MFSFDALCSGVLACLLPATVKGEVRYAQEDSGAVDGLIHDGESGAPALTATDRPSLTPPSQPPGTAEDSHENRLTHAVTPVNGLVSNLNG